MSKHNPYLTFLTPGCHDFSLFISYVHCMPALASVIGWIFRVFLPSSLLFLGYSSTCTSIVGTEGAHYFVATEDNGLFPSVTNILVFKPVVSYKVRQVFLQVDLCVGTIAVFKEARRMCFAFFVCYSSAIVWKLSVYLYVYVE